MDPVEALEQITYYLDRDLAPGAKAKAFLNAAKVIRDLPPGELEERHRTGRLKDLSGIGESTAKVITQALDGETPDYLAKLEALPGIPLDEGAHIRAALKGDCHLHSTWSDGGASIETMARTAMGLGHEYMVLTDHSARLTVAHGLDAVRLSRQLDEVARLNQELAPFRILTGMEVDILEDGALDLADEDLAQLDVVVASVHSKLSMPERDMTQRMVRAIANPNADILGHCTGRKVVGRGRAQSKFDADLVFAACARFDKAVEINCRPERQDPPDELLALALEWECRISIDTDAHAPGQLEWQNYGCDKAARHGVEPATIVNTLPVEELLAWAGAHAV
jgi:putative hydrolase